MTSSETIQKIIIISDSPTSQYHNKFSVFFAQKCVFESNITIEWVYTESGLGKGPADGVGATVKTVIDNVYHTIQITKLPIPNNLLMNDQPLVFSLKPTHRMESDH